jgi:hypothetical protein
MHPPFVEDSNSTCDEGAEAEDSGAHETQTRDGICSAFQDLNADKKK